MKSPAVMLVVATMVVGCVSAFVAPRAALPASATRVGSRRGAGAVAMKVWGGPGGDPPRFDPNDPRTLEQDSERWFAEQERREANGELNLFENPAFYSLLFVLTPVLILVWGFASGVIPGLVPVQVDYSIAEETSLKSVSYSDLTSAAGTAAARGGSLF